MSTHRNFQMGIWLALVFGIVLGTSNALTALTVYFERSRGTCSQHYTHSTCEEIFFPQSGHKVCKWDIHQTVPCVFSDVCQNRKPRNTGCGEGCFEGTSPNSKKTVCLPMEGWPAIQLGLYAAAFSIGVSAGNTIMQRIGSKLSTAYVTAFSTLAHALACVCLNILWNRDDLANNYNSGTVMCLILTRFISGCCCGIVLQQLVQQITMRVAPQDQWSCVKMIYVFEGIGFVSISSVCMMVSGTTHTLNMEATSAATIIAVFFALCYGTIVLTLQPLGLGFMEIDKLDLAGAENSKKEDEQEPVQAAAMAAGPTPRRNKFEIIRICVLLQKSVGSAVTLFSPFIVSIMINCTDAEFITILLIGIVYLVSSSLFQFTDFDNEMGDISMNVARGVQIVSCIAACYLIQNHQSRVANQGSHTADSSAFYWFLILAILVASSQVLHHGGKFQMKELSRNFSVFRQVRAQAMCDGIVATLFPLVLARGVFKAAYPIMQMEALFWCVGCFAVVTAIVTSGDHEEEAAAARKISE